jgi:hypothetical protein
VSPAWPPPDPKHGRFKPVERALQVAVVVVGTLAVLSVVLPGRASDVTGTATIVALMVVPMARVVWLAQRWLRRGDIRYGLVAVSVLLITAVGALLAR